MEPPSDRDIERLRAIARRVGELAHGRPEVVERLQRSWTDYVALHLAHMKEREEKALAQRRFAIQILKQGFLQEQPRKEYEPRWDREIFRVRVPVSLGREAKTAKTPEARAKLDAKVAKAILKYIRDEDEIVGCTDPLRRAELFERRETATPEGKYEQRTLTVGFRPRPEFEVGPHPLTCKWSEFQELPMETRITVALATLVELHDALSATPLLNPTRGTFVEGDPESLKFIVEMALRENLSSTQERGDPAAPPRPDPSRLSVERAEAFLGLLEMTAQEMDVNDDHDGRTSGQRGNVPRDNPTLVGSATAFGWLADNPPNLRAKEWEAHLRNWLRSVGNTTREQLGEIALPKAGFKRATLHDERPRVDDATLWLGLIASVFVDGVVPPSSPLDATPDALACFAFAIRDLRRLGPAPLLEVKAQTVIARFEGIGKYELSAPTLVLYTRRALRAMATREKKGRAGPQGAGGPDGNDVDLLANEMRSASWIGEVLKGVTAGRLRQMVNRDKLKKARKIDGKWHFNLQELADLMRDWRLGFTEAVEGGYRASGKKRRLPSKKS
jgi:hypothetical protein